MTDPMAAPRDQVEAPEIADLCLGSVFLATGGGGDPYVAQLLVERALSQGGPVRLATVDSLADRDWVVPLGEVGAPTVSLESLPVGNEPVAALDAFEALTGRAATHIVSFEIGGANSVIPILAAQARDIPLLDGDGMARALPEAQMMTYSIEGVSPTPAVGVDYRGTVVTLDTTDPDEYERQIRQLAMEMGGMIFTAEHAMTGEQARRAVIPGTISFAIDVGRLLREHRGSAELMLPRLIDLFASSIYGEVRHLYTGKVTSLDNRVVGGFDVGEAVIEPIGGGKDPLRIAIKNEYLVVQQGQRVLASVPDLICILDLETSRPINSERLRFGQRVMVVAIGCPAHYRTERALARVAPRCFGFDFDFVPIERQMI